MRVRLNQRWAYNAVALISALGALLVLYLVVIMSVERYATHALRSRLAGSGIEASFGSLELGLSVVCVRDLTLSARPQSSRGQMGRDLRRWSLKAGEGCVALSLNLKRGQPWFTVGDVAVNVVRLRVDQSLGAPHMIKGGGERRSKRADLLTREVILDDLTQATKRLRHSIERARPALARLEDLGSRVIKLDRVSVFIGRETRSILNGDLDVSARRLRLTLRTFRGSRITLREPAELTLTPEEVKLTRPIKLGSPSLQRDDSFTSARAKPLSIAQRLSAFTQKISRAVIPEIEVRAGSGINLDPVFPRARLDVKLAYGAHTLDVTLDIARDVALKSGASVPSRLHTRRVSPEPPLNELTAWRLGVSFGLNAPRGVRANADALERSRITLKLNDVRAERLSVELERLNLTEIISAWRLGRRIKSGHSGSSAQSSPHLLSHGWVKGTLSLPLRGLTQAEGIKGALTLSDLIVTLPGLPRLKLPQVSLAGVVTRTRVARSPHISRWAWRDAALIFEPQRRDPLKVSGALNLTLNTRALGPLRPIDALKLDVKMGRTRCQRLYDLTPRALLGPLKEATLSGVTQPSLRLTYHAPSRSAGSKKSSKKSSKKRDLLDFSLRGLSRRCTFDELQLDLESKPHITRGKRRLIPRDVTWLKRPFSYTIDPALTGKNRVRVGPESQDYIQLSKLPKYIGGAMYLTEETNFWRGGAVSWGLIKRAINTNLREGRFVYGGSTITQQLVKNLFLSREKHLARKFREAIISGAIVDLVSKERALELYLNVIEFGPGIFGIQSAARYYFQRDAHALTPQQAVFLSMLKVSPARGARWVKRGRSPSFTWWRARSVQVFERLVEARLISPEQARGAAPFVLSWSNGVYQGVQTLAE